MNTRAAVLLLLFPLFCIVFFNLPSRRQPTALLAASIAFIASFGATALAAYALTTWLGYAFARRIAEGEPRADRLIAAIALICTPLAIAKYWVGELPAGISFYTFAVIAYVVDVYIGRCEVETAATRFALFTGFFPKFLVGPIERAARFLPQVAAPKRFDYERVTDGIRIMAWGLLKKTVVADRLGLVVDAVYAHREDYRGVVLAMTGIFYLFQLYYDFSGYSEIALGAARVLGFEVTWNFNRPYAARSIAEYWRRWHISLTAWLFDYIFAPVAAALRRLRGAGVLVAMMMTFLVSGIWHGAAWTFVIYGLVHGTAMSIDFLTAGRRRGWSAKIPARLYEPAAWAVTLGFVACTDVIFRSPTISAAWGFLHDLFAGLGPDFDGLLRGHFSTASFKAMIAGIPVLKGELILDLCLIAGLEFVSFLGRERPLRTRLAAKPRILRWAVYYFTAGAIVYFGAQNNATEFVYMQF